MWPTSDITPTADDVTPVPLLSSPDLDALCDPDPARSAAFLLPAPPRSSPSSSAYVSSSLTLPSAPPAQISACHSGSSAF